MSADNQQGRPFVRKEPSETIRQIPQQQALAISLGILYTDGCVSPKGHSWRIYFVNKSFHLIALFKDCISNVFRTESPNVRIGITTDGLYKAVVDSKTIGNKLVNRFGTFRTQKFQDGKYPDTKLPLQFLRTNKLIVPFLQAAFSCDGGLCFYPAKRSGKNGGTTWLIRTIFLACAHPQLRSDYIQLLFDLGIRVREVSLDGKIKIETKIDIFRFAKLVRFVSGVCVTAHSKYWNGYEKNQVLDLMISSYSDPPKFYQLSNFQR